MTDHYLKRELFELLRTDDDALEFLLDSVLDGVWYWDLERPEHEWMNGRFWETLGVDPATKTHSPDEWQDLIHKEGLDEALVNLDKHLADPAHRYDQVVGYRHASGKSVWIRCRGRASRDEDGRPVRMLGAHHEVTALVEARNELHAANERLERFVHVAAHDLRAPLNTVAGFLELAEDPETKPDELRALLSRAREPLDRGRTLVDRLFELLVLSRRSVTSTPFAGDEAAAEATESVQPSIEAAGGTVEIGPIGELVGERPLLVTVLQNLLSNAVTYRSPERPLRIEIGGGPNELWVRDNGVGIAPDRQDMIFEAFDRGGRGHDGADHMGLGLAWCKQVLELHGGTIEVESAPGAGSTFRMAWTGKG